MNKLTNDINAGESATEGKSVSPEVLKDHLDLQHLWNKFSVEQRLNVMVELFPMDFMLNKKGFTDYANKSWKDLPKGTTQNAINAVLVNQK